MKRTLGFTLVEVMVVMVIITALAGLVGPFTIEAINKNERRTELSTLTNALKKAGYRAYLRQSRHTVVTQDHTLTISDLSQVTPWQILSFKHLSFPKQELTINENGFISPSYLTVEFNNKKDTVLLDEKVNGITEVKL